jgi:hypothetical protein
MRGDESPKFALRYRRSCARRQRHGSQGSDLLESAVFSLILSVHQLEKGNLKREVATIALPRPDTLGLIEL